jgi:hypothetical protein
VTPSVAHHESARERGYAQPVHQLVGRFDLGDPDVVLVPLTGDSMRSRVQRRKKVREQSAHRDRPFGAPAVYCQKLAVRGHEVHRRTHIEPVERSEQPFDGRLAH